MKRTIIISVSMVLVVTFVAIGSLPSVPNYSTTLTEGMTVSGVQDDAFRPFDDEPSGRRERSQEQDITPELAERIIEIANDIDESLAARLRAVCDTHPQEFERVVRSHRRLLALAELKEKDPHLYELKAIELKSDRQRAILARQIAEARQAGDATSEEVLRQELLNTMRIHQAFSIMAREQYVQRLEQHIIALREDIERDKNNFDVVVDRLVDEAIHRAEDALASEGTTADRRR